MDRIQDILQKDLIATKPIRSLTSPINTFKTLNTSNKLKSTLIQTLNNSQPVKTFTMIIDTKTAVI
jgi:hypothetical protein